MLRHARRFTLSGLVLVVALACAGASGAPGAREGAPDGPLHLIVLHTNDVHGQVLPREGRWLDRENPPLVGGLPRVAGYVNAVRAEAERVGAELLVVDAGDWFQGTPEGQVGRGDAFMEALALVGYDALAVGNHDLDHGFVQLQGLIERHALPAVCANVREADGTRPAWLAPWRVVERGGLRIALVGLLSVETPSITHADAQRWTFVDPAAALVEARAELGDDVDWVLPLTHDGIESDRELARALPDLDLVVGGHSHTYLKEGIDEGGVRIVQVGSKASAVGRVDLWFDSETRAVVRLESRAVDLVEEIPETWRDARVEELCARLVETTEASMAEVVGELETPLPRAKGPLESSPAGNLVADLFRRRTDADVALMNRGGIRCDLPAGPVTRRAVFEFLPFDNHLVTVELSGAELFEVLRRSVEGVAHSGLELSGAMLFVSTTEEGRATLAEVRVQGEPLDRERVYRVTVNSFMAGGGDDYLDADAGGERREDPILMRDVLEETLRKRGKLRADASNRYRVVR